MPDFLGVKIADDIPENAVADGDAGQDLVRRSYAVVTALVHERDPCHPVRLSALPTGRKNRRHLEPRRTPNLLLRLCEAVTKSRCPER